jgi:hypothetical protein
MLDQVCQYMQKTSLLAESIAANPYILMVPLTVQAALLLII